METSACREVAPKLTAAVGRLWLGNPAVDGWFIHVYPIIYRVSTCFKHPFGGAGLRNHPQDHALVSIMEGVIQR